MKKAHDNQLPSTNPLRSYLHLNDLGVEVELEEEYAEVVQRISAIIPDELLWRIFSSAPAETGGRIVFPYSRVDSSVMIAKDICWLLDEHGKQYPREKWAEWYKKGCIQAFEALLWVDIGFQGLDNLAQSPASSNWTAAVGHFVTADERGKGIMTGGKALFESCLRSFVQFREREGIADDYFTAYNVEYLLGRFRS